MAENAFDHPYFDARHLPDPQPGYVTWLDVMGTRSIMGRSLPITANFVFKLHVAALEVPREGIDLYPVMDGVYVVATRKCFLQPFLRDVFSRLARVLVAERNVYHRFLIKAAVAYGPVVHGRDLPRQASEALAGNPEYRNSILLGMPMVQSFQTEQDAPPFGVSIHESAGLTEYFDWCGRHSYALAYDADRINTHKEMARQYFGELEPQIREAEQ